MTAADCDQQVLACVESMMHSLAAHGDLAPGHTAEAVKILVDCRDHGLAIDLIWRDVAPDGTDRLRVSMWSQARSPRTSAA